jgi:hypothetical protein
MPEMLQLSFSLKDRREALLGRLLELRALIPQFESEKARIEGQIAFIDELAGGFPQMPPDREGTPWTNEPPEDMKPPRHRMPPDREPPEPPKKK